MELLVKSDLDPILARWTRLGAGFNIEPADRTPDLERLLVDTARHAPEMARLFIMAASWLGLYAPLVAKARLAMLSRCELDDDQKAALGFLIEASQQAATRPRLRSISKGLRQQVSDPSHRPGKPLFLVSRGNPLLAARARQRASALSDRWGLWCDSFELKGDAIRPREWLFSTSPELRLRADLQGDMRASVLAALHHEPDASRSELHLARLAGGSRSAVRAALDALELAGHVRVERTPGGVHAFLAGSDPARAPLAA
jgi:hypothetical protein